MALPRSSRQTSELVFKDTAPNVLDTYSQYQSYFRLFMVPEPDALAKNLPSSDEWFIVAETGGSEDTSASVEDVEITTYGGLDKETGIGMATNFSIQVVQPNSVSVLDDILRAKDKLGIRQFLSIPFFLELTFRVRDPDSQDPLGWQELRDHRRVWPILIKNTSTRVTSAGSITDIQAVFYADLAMSSEFVRTRQEIEITATTVQDFFDQLGEQMSDPPEDTKKREKAAYLREDQYEIKVEIPEVANEKLEPTDQPGKPDQQLTRNDQKTEESDSDVSSVVEQTIQELERIDRVIQDNIHELRRAGSFAVLSNEALEEAIIQKVQQIAGVSELEQADAKVGTSIAIHRGQSLQNIIIDIMLDTKHFQTKIASNTDVDETNKGLVNQSREDKFKKFFRIVQDVELTDYNTQTKTYNKKFIYRVVPYDASTPMSSAQDTELIRTDIGDYAGKLLKSYNYNFTGLNNSVLNLDLSFNFHWYVALAKQAGQLQRTPVGDETPKETDTPRRDEAIAEKQAPELSGNIDIPTPAYVTGDPSDILQHADMLKTTGRNIISVLFEQLQEPISKDLVVIDLEIRGDPFWLEPNPMPNLTGDVPGYRTGEPNEIHNNSTGTQTYFLLTTYLPEPYNVNTGLMPNPSDRTIISGVYSVKKVIHQFSNGRFTQTLSAFKDIRLNYQSVQIDKSGQPVLFRRGE